MSKFVRSSAELLEARRTAREYARKERDAASKVAAVQSNDRISGFTEAELAARDYVKGLRE
eukprot:261224-Amphidinium_carterae.1